MISLSGSANEFSNLTMYPGFGPAGTVSSALAVADNRLQNISTLRVDGVDANVGQHGRLSQLIYSLGMEGGYLLKYQEKFLQGTAPQDLLSTFENPVNLRGRLSASLGFHELTVHGALNYTNHYNNTRGETPYRIASWSTVDFGITYQVAAWSYFRESRIQLSCTNCLNRLPPYAGTSGYVFAFDPVNASPLGRFASLEMQAEW
ncbi:MAG: TonB-dependent receptor domain-containing protein [Terriglobia bacterium]